MRVTWDCAGDLHQPGPVDGLRGADVPDVPQGTRGGQMVAGQVQAEVQELVFRPQHLRGDARQRHRRARRQRSSPAAAT